MSTEEELDLLRRELTEMSRRWRLDANDFRKRASELDRTAIGHSMSAKRLGEAAILEGCAYALDACRMGCKTPGT